jgi:hypothetical protein
MSNSGFYDAGTLREIATNLFYGWGYNFYRIENQLRSDDQLVRSKAASLLGMAMACVSEAETEYRQKFLPRPSRQKPFPDAAAMKVAQDLERLAREIDALEALIQQQPVPENDRMSERFRQEASTLKALIRYDEQLVGQCELLRSMVNRKDGSSIVENVPALARGLEAIRVTLQNREAVLLDRAR